MATVLPLTRRPNPPSWSNMVSSAGSSSLGLYVLHRETATGAVGACAARPSGEPASQAPERALAVVDNHCLRVRRHCTGTASCLLICNLPVQTPHTEKPAAASRGFQGEPALGCPEKSHCDVPYHVRVREETSLPCISPCITVSCAAFCHRWRLHAGPGSWPRK